MPSNYFNSSNPRWRPRRNATRSSKPIPVANQSHWLKKVEDGVGILLKAATLFLIGVLLFWLFRSVNKEGFTIEPFSVPKHLAESGYDGATIARKIQDEVLNLKEEASSIKADSVQLSREDVPDLDISVLSVGFSLNSLTYHIRDLLGRKNNYVRGEVTQLDSVYTITIRMTNQVPIERQVVIKNNEQDAIASLLREGGEAVLENTDPYRLAVVCYKNKRYRDAMRAIKRVIEEHPEEAHWGYLAWGSLLQRQEKLPQAVRKYKQAIKIKPDFLLPLTNMAWLQRRIGETKEAHQHMRQATQQNWDDIDRLRGNVWFFHMEEDYAMADSIFSRIMELAPDSPFSYMSWADSQFSRGNQERALELLKQNEALFGDTADGLAMKAFAKFVAKDTLGALADIEAAFELDPAHPAATSNTMRAYYMKEDYERIFEIAAMADWDNMKEDDLFQQQDALDIWAQAHIQLKEYEAARQLCRRNILRGQFYAGSYITYAKTFAYENQRDSLYHYMRAGFEKGFEEKWLELDKPPLDKFANDPPFQKLLEKYRRTQPLKG